MKFSYLSTFIIPCSIFDIRIPVKNIKNNLALMGLHPPLYPGGLSVLTLMFRKFKVVERSDCFVTGEVALRPTSKKPPKA